VNNMIPIRSDFLLTSRTNLIICYGTHILSGTLFLNPITSNLSSLAMTNSSLNINLRNSSYDDTLFLERDNAVNGLLALGNLHVSIINSPLNMLQPNSNINNT